MAKKDAPRDPNALVKFNEKVLANLKRRLNGCTAEDMKVLIKRDVKELEEKIERIKLNIREAK